jgi:predicted Zn-dependent peptidase
VELAKRKFRFPKGMADAALPAKRSRDYGVTIERTPQKQTHFCLGFPAPGYPTPDKMAILALSSYLGGGMSSVLFQKIREDRGLAYSVYTFTDFYRDTGVFGAYLGTDKKHLRQALEVILREVRTLKRKKLSALQLRQIKSQMQGHLLLGMESTTSRMNRIARQELMTGRYQPLEHMVREIEAVTVSKIMELANRIFDERAAAATVLGPVDHRALSGLL